jgi:HK97 family phage portal protein
MRKQAYLRLYKKMPNGERKEVFDHELVRFTEKVNNETFTDDFITEHLIYLLTIGEFFVYKPELMTGMNKGLVPEIFPLPSSEVEILEGTMFNPVRGYRIEGNWNVEFEKKEIYHSKLFNPDWKDERSLHGLSPLRAASKTVSKLNQIELTQLKQYENQGAPYILFKEVSGNNAIDINSNRMTPEQQAETIKAIKKSQSEKTRGLPLVLKDKMGKLDLGQKLADMEIINSSNEAKEALCGVYGIPPELFGLGARTYSNMSVARKAAWTDCVMPFLDKVTTTFNASIITEKYKDYCFDFDYSDVEELQEGIKEKVEWMVKARWTGNEIRQGTGKAPFDNPLMDEPTIPMGDGFLSDYSGDDLIDQDGKSFDDYK